MGTKLIFIIIFLLSAVIFLFFCGKGCIKPKEYTKESVDNPILKTGEYQRIYDKASWGYKDSIGNIIIPLGKYEFLNPIDDKGMIFARKEKKGGYIDINENILIPFIYDDLGVFSKCVELAPAVINFKQGFINRKGETVIPFEYDYIYSVDYFHEPGIAVLLKNGKYGAINANNETIIPFIYSEINFTGDRETLFVWQQDKWACFSSTGKQLSDFSNFKIISPPAGYLPEDSKNLPILIATKGEKKYAYIDKYQNFVVPFGVYYYTDVFGLGRKAIVANKGKYGIINENGEVVLPLVYDFIERPAHYSNYANIFVATRQNTVTILNEDGNVVSEANIISYLNDNGNLCVVNKENKKGLINYNGELTIPFLYDTLYKAWPVYKDQGYIAKKNGFYGSITQENKIIQPFKYNYIYVVSGNLAYLDQNNKVGIFNEDGSIMIPFEYDAIYESYYNDMEVSFPNIEEIYVVEKEGKIGTIDNKNNVIIPIVYDGLSGWVEYSPDDHIVKNEGKYGIISPKGKIIIPIEYDLIGFPQNDIIKVKKNGKYGIISLKNKEIIPCTYDIILLDFPMNEFDEISKKPKIVVLRQNIWSYYDLNGKLLQSEVPLKEINDKYEFYFNWGESSNENYDNNIDLIQKGKLRERTLLR